MKVAISGASGLVGSALVPFLRGGGHAVLRLVRRAPRAEDEARWDPAAGTIDAAALEGVDAVVNLSGANLAEAMRDVGRRWLALRATPYEIDATVLERWVAGEGALALALAPRLEREGLALLGPEALARLSHTAAHPRVKAIAGRWHARLVH